MTCRLHSLSYVDIAAHGGCVPAHSREVEVELRRCVYRTGICLILRHVFSSIKRMVPNRGTVSELHTPICLRGGYALLVFADEFGVFSPFILDDVKRHFECWFT